LEGAAHIKSKFIVMSDPTLDPHVYAALYRPAGEELLANS
jgi:hypothetical protein